MDGEENTRIKILSTDESLKILGELLSNESSRKMIRMMISRAMYANEIASKLELRSNLVVHHLRKMESIGLLNITCKRIIRKGKEHNHFQVHPGMLVTPCMQDEEIKNRFLKGTFRGGVKFIAIGIASLLPLAVQLSLVVTSEPNIDYDSVRITSSSIMAGLTIAVLGLVMERIHSSRKK